MVLCIYISCNDSLTWSCMAQDNSARSSFFAGPNIELCRRGRVALWTGPSTGAVNYLLSDHLGSTA